MFEVEIKPIDPQMLEPASRPHRTVCRPFSRLGAGHSFHFGCFGNGPAPCAYASIIEGPQHQWDLGLYVSGPCDEDALSPLLAAAIDAARSRGGTVVQTAIEIESDLPLQLFRRLGLFPRSLFQQGGESAAEFDISFANPAR